MLLSVSELYASVFDVLKMFELAEFSASSKHDTGSYRKGDKKRISDRKHAVETLTLNTHPSGDPKVAADFLATGRSQCFCQAHP